MTNDLTAVERVILKISGALPRLLFVIAGPSGVGKNTIIKRLLANHPAVMDRVRTYTTRERRAGEIDGEQYHFVTKEHFRELALEGKLLEAAGHDVYKLGDWYSMPAHLYQDVAPDKHIVIAEVDIVGARLLRQVEPGCITIFLTAPPLELIRRILERPDQHMDGKTLQGRMDAAREHIRAAREFDYLVFNEAGKLDETEREIEKIVAAERMRVRPGVDLEALVPPEAFQVDQNQLETR